MNLQKKVAIDRKKITECAMLVLNAMGEDKAELSLLFVDDAYIKRLNLRYRNVNSKTDVLAFSMREGEGVPEQSCILGDVVISTETAARESKKRKSSIDKEMHLYLIHGILHLLGYDDKSAADRKKMKSKERELLEVM